MDSLAACSNPASNEVRPPAVAGSFYPSDPGKLKLAIQKFLEDSPSLEIETPIAILAPHAGYIYAGQIYADAYRQVMGKRYDVIVILGTNHTTGGFSGVSLGDYSAFRTPLGDVQIDQEVVSALLKESKDCRRDREVHIKEHSVEVQVPFIQTLFPQAKIVPAVIYPPDLDLCKRFGEALARVLSDRRALIVISTDLSHYPAASEAVKVDRSTLETITKLDIRQIASLMRSLNVPNLDTRACGEASILAGLTAAKLLGAKSAIVAGYANSGDVAIGDQSRAVGYGAVVLAKDDRADNHENSGSCCTFTNGHPSSRFREKISVGFGTGYDSSLPDHRNDSSGKKLVGQNGFPSGGFCDIEEKWAAEGLHRSYVSGL